jgi:hypothetical protein
MRDDNSEDSRVAWISWHLSLRDLAAVVVCLFAGFLGWAFLEPGWMLVGQIVMLVAFLGSTEED